MTNEESCCEPSCRKSTTRSMSCISFTLTLGNSQPEWAKMTQQGLVSTSRSRATGAGLPDPA